jgi:O-antigen/teichoic acid export membrane protein
MSSGPYTRHDARTAVFHAVLLRVPAQAANFLAYILLVRLLSETDFGIYSLLYATLPVVGTAASFGLENTLRRYQPQYLRTGENRLAHWLVRRVALLRLVTNFGVVCVIFAFWSWLAPLFKIENYNQQFAFFSLVLLTHFQCSILTTALASHLLQKYSTGLTAVFAILKLIGYLAAKAIFDFDLWTAISVDLVAYLIFFATLKYYYTFRPDHSSGQHDSPPKEEKRRLLRYGAYYNFNDAGTLALSDQKDSFFIAAFINPVAVGAHAFANRLMGMVGRVTPLQQMRSVIEPIFISLDYRKRPEKTHTYFSILLTFAMLARIPLFVYFTCYHRQLVQVVFNSRFLDYSYLLPAVALFSISDALATPVTLVAQLKEEARIILASKIIGIYNILASLTLIPIIGVMGAVIANGTGTMFKNLFIWWFVRDLARWKGALRFLTTSAVIWGAYGIVAFAIVSVFSTPISQLVVGTIAWFLFILLQLRNGISTPEQKKAIAALFSGREQRWLRLLGLV